MWKSVLGWVVLLLCIGIRSCIMTKINYSRCDRAGWKCVKIQESPIKYEFVHTCQNTNGIIISLWNFNAPAEIKELKIANCTAVEIDLTCTAVGRQIESLHLQNIGVFNFTNLLYKDHAQMPEKVILENITNIPEIPEKTFKQMLYPPASSYRCAVNTKPLEKISFRNVTVGILKSYAFYNLTNIKEFIWDTVTVHTMEELSLNIQMQKSEYFHINKSTFNNLFYKSFAIRSPNIIIKNSNFQNLPTNTINSTSFNFSFINNTVQTVSSFAFQLLTQNIIFEHNRFDYLKTSALQGVGPGLLENAFMSFGDLKFSYIFRNNTVGHSDISGLNPDWIAYKNLRSEFNVTWNYLPCSCEELGWITLREGLGRDFSKMLLFDAKFLDRTNNNLCLSAPCKIPLTILAAMHIKFGVCSHQESIAKLCQQYNPKSPNSGLSEFANSVLKRWRKEFSSFENNELQEDVDEMENITMNEHKTILQYSNMKPKESYFKIEKAGLVDIDPMDIVNEIATNTSQIEVPEPSKDSTILFPDINFEDNSDRNESLYKYDVRMNTNNDTFSGNDTVIDDKGNSTTNIDKGFSVLKKEYEANQKDFLKQSFNQWRAERKKRMVYFKLYGNLMTLG